VNRHHLDRRHARALGNFQPTHPVRGLPQRAAALRIQVRQSRHQIPGAPTPEVRPFLPTNLHQLLHHPRKPQLCRPRRQAFPPGVPILAEPLAHHRRQRRHRHHFPRKAIRRIRQPFEQMPQRHPHRMVLGGFPATLLDHLETRFPERIRHRPHFVVVAHQHPARKRPLPDLQLA